MIDIILFFNNVYIFIYLVCMCKQYYFVHNKYIKVLILYEYMAKNT